mgnify:CR=1 FL=1
MKPERHLKYTQTNPIAEVIPPERSGVAPIIAKTKLIQRVNVPKDKPIYQMDVIDIMNVYFNKENEESDE